LACAACIESRPLFLRTADLDIESTALQVVQSPIGFTVGSVFAGYIVQRSIQISPVRVVMKMSLKGHYI
jgi:hypothetical protein